MMPNRLTPAEAEERFWAKVDQAGECWLWTGDLDQNGYGNALVNRRKRKAHRVAYEALVGPIPEGLELDHLCRVRNCVRPDHCEPVDHRTNVLRGNTVTAANAAKSRCLRGHPFDDDNTYVRPNGNRNCKKCHADRERELHHARRAAVQ